MNSSNPITVSSLCFSSVDNSQIFPIICLWIDILQHSVCFLVSLLNISEYCSPLNCPTMSMILLCCHSIFRKPYSQLTSSILPHLVTLFGFADRTQVDHLCSSCSSDYMYLILGTARVSLYVSE